MSDYLTVADLADLLRCSRNAVYKRLYRGLIPERAIVRMGPRTLLFKRAVLDRTVLKGGYCRGAPEATDPTSKEGGEP